MIPLWNDSVPVHGGVYLRNVKFPEKCSEEQHLWTKGLDWEIDVGIFIDDEKGRGLKCKMLFSSQTCLPPSCQKLSSLLLGPHHFCFSDIWHRVRHWGAFVITAHRSREPDPSHRSKCSSWSNSSNPPAAAAAAAKSLQSCLTLWDPRDGSPPGSPVPGILQARTLEWVAISFATNPPNNLLIVLVTQ